MKLCDTGTSADVHTTAIETDTDWH